MKCDLGNFIVLVTFVNFNAKIASGLSRNDNPSTSIRAGSENPSLVWIKGLDKNWPVSLQNI